MENKFKSLHKEFWVGALFILVVGLLIVFAWLMGALGPMHKQVKYYLLYNFAGGVEVGSPVRVSGVKVGKVARIEFLPEQEANQDERVTLKITIDISAAAGNSVREDSRFYVNMAGIIGERYIEISPGSVQSAPLKSGAVIRGIDPPRIDQLISQGYGVFGRIEDFLEENERTLSEFLIEMKAFMTDANRVLKGRDKNKLVQLLDNLNAITGDIHELATKLKNPQANKLYDQVFDIVDRVHEIDKPAVKKFLQEEGIRARIF